MIVKPIQYLLFDADGTLLDFPAAEEIALGETFAQFGYSLTPNLKEAYTKINEELWKELELGKISLEYLCMRRFEKLFLQEGIPLHAKVFDAVYMERLAKRDDLIPDAFEVCKSLSQTHTLAVLTNGITYVQKKRLEYSGLLPFFKHVFVSDEIGFSKPNPRFFQYVFEQIKIADKESVLLIGDSLSADIKGGNLYGINTCWYNPNHRTNVSGLSIPYEISSLKQILPLLSNHRL